MWNRIGKSSICNSFSQTVNTKQNLIDALNKNNISASDRRGVSVHYNPTLHQEATSREKCWCADKQHTNHVQHFSQSQRVLQRWAVMSRLTSEQTSCWIQQTWCNVRSNSGSETATIHHCLLSMRRKHPGEKGKSRGLRWRWQTAAVCVRACVYDCSSEACCLVTECVRPSASELIKYPFGLDCTVDATISMATASEELNNIRLSLPYMRPAALLWLSPWQRDWLTEQYTCTYAQTHPGWKGNKRHLHRVSLHHVNGLTASF